MRGLCKLLRGTCTLTELGLGNDLMKSSSMYLCLLLLIASPAFSAANTNGDEPNVVSKTRVITQPNAAQENETANTAQPAVNRPMPVVRATRSAAPRTVSPRWHSMLPGMFR